MPAYRNTPNDVLRYRDFVPKQVEPAGFIREAKYESFDAALDAANEWITKYEVQVANVETVLLPNIWKSEESGSTDTSLRTSGESSARWHQLIRVWHWVANPG